MAARRRQRKAGRSRAPGPWARLRRIFDGTSRRQRLPSRWWPSPRLWVAVTFLTGIVVGALGLHAVSRIETFDRTPETAATEPAGASTIPETSVPAEQPDPAPAEPVADPVPASPPDNSTYEAATEQPGATMLPPAETTEPADTASALPPLPVETVASLRALPAAQIWLANALPAVDTGGRPMIAIVIDDVGVDRANSPGAIALPAPVTLSFMSYADGLAAMTQEARARGHELMLHLPMEPIDPTVDPGPHGLRLSNGPAAIEADVRWALARFDGYIGVNNHMGSRFTRSREGMGLVLAELRRRGLMFLDSRTVGDTVGISVASELGVPHLVRDVFLDNDPSAPAIEAQLAELERIARERGYAIGIGHPYPSTLDVLNRWLPGLAARGIVAVPVSTILRQKLGVAG